jgi:hypothetical protein
LFPSYPLAKFKTTHGRSKRDRLIERALRDPAVAKRLKSDRKLFLAEKARRDPERWKRIKTDEVPTAFSANP